MTRALLAGIAALLMATSAGYARPELSKSQSWKLIQGTWCLADPPSDNEGYVGIARDKCDENEKTLIIRENGYSWEREDGLRTANFSHRRCRRASASIRATWRDMLLVTICNGVE